MARHGLTPSQYQNQFDELTNERYRLTLVGGHAIDGEARYAAIWEKRDGPAWAARHGMSGSQYQDQFDKFVDRGYRPSHVSGFSVDGDARYAAIWEKHDGSGWVAHHGMSGSQYQNQFDGYVYQGYRLIGVSGYSVNSDARFAAIWETDGLDRSDINTIDRHITNYKNQHGIPGLSMGITKDERLVFAKGYGDADRGANETVRPSHRFRIASISKPITAVATMELVESDELRLADTVFGSNGILRPKYGTPAYGSGISSPNPNSITVYHLLEHSSGWRNNGNDPMFDHPNKNQDELIRHVVGNRALQYEPGTDDEYLNFGYCVLGRVIEEVAGRPYEEYVEDAVLSACGIDRMGIAGDTKSERKPEEVIYYGGNPYGMQVARMDAHGGWIATPIDLLRFVTRVDGFDRKADILRPESETELYNREGPNRDYGEGWILQPNWRGHNGAFSGSIGFLVRRDDGFSFAALANARPSSDRFAGQLRNTVDTAINDVDDWPSYDLF